jgi:hypothetical protein
MEELLDMIAADESPSQISDKIKDLLFAKSTEKIEAIRPSISNSLFGFNDSNNETSEDQ